VSNPRGILTFGSDVTGTPGYSGVGGWNSYAGFMLGEITSFNKSEQFEELSGRENQYGLYLSDRWTPSEKITRNLGVRYEYYPLTIAHSDSGLNSFTPYGRLETGIALAPNPDVSSGTVILPRGVDMTTPDADHIARGATQSYNVVIERRLPLDIVTSVGYVGT